MIYEQMRFQSVSLSSFQSRISFLLEKEVLKCRRNYCVCFLVRTTFSMILQILYTSEINFCLFVSEIHITTVGVT